MLEKLANCDERQFKALPGLFRAVFNKLLTVLSLCYAELVQENYEQNQANRQRKPEVGQKGRLNTMDKKLFFMLYYLKVYPTYDVLGYHFDLGRSKACANVQRLQPVLLKALDRLGVLPKRHFNSVEELQQARASASWSLMLPKDRITDRKIVKPKEKSTMAKRDGSPAQVVIKAEKRCNDG